MDALKAFKYFKEEAIKVYEVMFFDIKNIKFIQYIIHKDETEILKKLV